MRGGIRGGLRGGLDRRAAAGVIAHRPNPNAQDLMQEFCPPDMAEATTDRHDRAHGVYAADRAGGGLLPARLVPEDVSRPRRYHTSLMVGPEEGRVSFETAIERCEVDRARLRAELGDVEGVTCGESLGAITGVMMARGGVR